MSDPRYASDSCDLDGLRRWLKARPESLVPLTIRRIDISPDALDDLGDRAEAAMADRPVCHLIMDRTPMWRDGVPIKPEVVAALSARVGEVGLIELGEADHPPHADIDRAKELSKRLTAGALVVTFGSGTITDLAKHAMFWIEQDGGARFEHICCPTACTVTAFTASMTVLTVDGVKRTIRSRSPDQVLVDLLMIRDAPVELTRAGLGDLLARCTAYGDWYLGDAFGVDESFNTVPFDLLAHPEERLIAGAASIGRRELDGLRSLADALMLAGIGMSIVDQTTPISGWEHVMSHYLDLRAVAADRPTGLHGAQVGAGTLIAALAFEELLGTREAFWRSARPVFDVDAARKSIEEHFKPFDADGGMIEELWREYGAKAERIRQGLSRWPRVVERWLSGDIPAQLQRYVRRAEVVATALGQAEAEMDLAAASGTADRILARSAILYGHKVRSRFTLGDVLEILGLLTPAAADRWLTAGSDTWGGFCPPS
jgi:glycerol-1-phosphate dehydrogenase [NAD(P)+]